MKEANSMNRWFKHPVRRSQVVSPFGTGNITSTISGRSVVIGGTENFFKREIDDIETTDVIVDRFIVHDWRLEKELNVDHFRLPPTWKKSGENARCRIPVLNFPLYFRCSNPKCNSLFEVYPQDVESIGCKKCGSSNPVQVRFITICKAGHMQDFPWAEWVHRKPRKEIDPNCFKSLKMKTKSSAKLSGIQIECEGCDVKPRMLSSRIFQLTENEEYSSWLSENLYDGDQQYNCPGHLPWLGKRNEPCNEAPIVALRGQGNVYFPKTRSSIFIPSSDDFTLAELSTILEDEKYKDLRALLRIQGKPNGAWDETWLSERALGFKNMHPQYEETDIITAFKNKVDDIELHQDNSDVQLSVNSYERDIQYRFFEFESLKKSKDTKELSIEIPNIRDFLDENSNEDYSKIFKKISHISLIKSLTETTALTGFSRVYPYSYQNIQETFDPQIPKNEKNWLLARQSKGEGIFIELNEESLLEWESRDKVQERSKKLEEFYLQTNLLKDRVHLAKPRHLLIHTLAHVLMKELVYACGYGSASLRERLYISESSDTKMSAFMIYTAAGDTDGSLGGLVKEGQPYRLANTLRNAILKSRWCTYDPVCASVSDLSGGSDHACLSCCFSAETSCETGNAGLERTFLGADADDYFQDVAFFDF